MTYKSIYNEYFKSNKFHKGIIDYIYTIVIYLKFFKNNYQEYSSLMGKRENLWKQYHRAKTEEDKSKILTKINNIQSFIKELRKLKNYCNNIEERSKIIQNNLNNFDKDLNKEKDNSRYL